MNAIRASFDAREYEMINNNRVTVPNKNYCGLRYQKITSSACQKMVVFLVCSMTTSCNFMHVQLLVGLPLGK